MRRRPLRPGEAVAPGYDVVAHLHRGRTLDVYDVWSDERRCRCVAKVLRPDRAHEARPRRRLRREGRLLLALTHPHIVRAYELVDGREPVLILETLTGATLSFLIEESKRGLPATEVVELGLQVTSALQYLHRSPLLHLDLKPSNVVAERGFAKLIDLSISRSPGRARRGVGTRQYMAPEQARGATLSEATDVWGLGALLYEAATGTRPFAPDDGRGCPQLRRRPDPVRARRTRLPRVLASTIDACLAERPRDRPSLQEVEAALAPLRAAG